jgi:GNAT superfamily N-acetyltransferase
MEVKYMNIKIRQAKVDDKSTYVDLAVKLSKFNRENHDEKCKYDDFEQVIRAIRNNAEQTFDNMNGSILILIAELEDKPVGYALGRIFQQDEAADNGTGLMGLLDELFIENEARGFGLGSRLIDEVISWMKVKGVTRVKLHSYSWNNNARKLYEQKGFCEYVVSYEKFL